jgi:hypothetical protein
VAEPTSFSLKEPIPLGTLVVSVSSAKVVTSPPVPLSSLRAQPGEKVVAVFVTLEGLDAFEGLDRRSFAEKFLEGRSSLEDPAGRRTPAWHAMPKGLYHNFGDLGGTQSPDYVVVFHVPEESRDLTLLLENPEPGQGQPQLGAVELGL